jgi:hypothetical protein
VTVFERLTPAVVVALGAWIRWRGDGRRGLGVRIFASGGLVFCVKGR